MHTYFSYRGYQLYSTVLSLANVYIIFWYSGTVRKKEVPNRPPRQRDMLPVRPEYYNLCYPASEAEDTGSIAEVRGPVPETRGPTIEGRDLTMERRLPVTGSMNVARTPSIAARVPSIEARVPTIPRRRQAVDVNYVLLS